MVSDDDYLIASVILMNRLIGENLFIFLQNNLHGLLLHIGLSVR